MDGFRADQTADEVHRQIRAGHAACQPEGCALRRLWDEDVREVVVTTLHLMAEQTPPGAAWTAADLQRAAEFGR